VTQVIRSWLTRLQHSRHSRIRRCSRQHANIPKKGNQFHPKVLARDRQIASKRVHIERHIGLIKTYKILSQPMNLNEASLGSEIIFVCCMLSISGLALFAKQYEICGHAEDAYGAQINSLMLPKCLQLFSPTG